MSLLSSLCRSNRGILSQKLGLMKALINKHGQEQAGILYSVTCPIVKATIGQHFRHSMDHMERAAMAASDATQQQEIHYDFRERGGLDERDMEAAQQRIKAVDDMLSQLSTNYALAVDRPVFAGFMLSGDSEDEYLLPSTVARELGFAAHHGIHHMAMIRIIALCEHVGQLSDTDLPVEFGRAPSTVNYDRHHTK